MEYKVGQIWKYYNDDCELRIDAIANGVITRVSFRSDNLIFEDYGMWIPPRVPRRRIDDIVSNQLYLVYEPS